LIKSVGKSEHARMLWPQNFKNYNLLCWYEEEFFFFLEGGLVVCRWGELGWGRRRRNRGWEGRQSCHILTFSDGFTDGHSVGYYADDSDGNRHVTVRICHFKSLGESVENFNGEPVTSLYGHCTGSRFWIRRWFRRNKKTHQNLHVSDPPFFKFGNFSVCNSVGKYRRKFSVGIYRLNYGQKSFRRFLPTELRTESGRR